MVDRPFFRSQGGRHTVRMASSRTMRVDTRPQSAFPSAGSWMRRCHIHDTSSGCVDKGTVCKPCEKRLGTGYTTVGFLGKWFGSGVVRPGGMRWRWGGIRKMRGAACHKTPHLFPMLPRSQTDTLSPPPPPPPPVLRPLHTSPHPQQAQDWRVVGDCRWGCGVCGREGGNW